MWAEEQVANADCAASHADAMMGIRVGVVVIVARIVAVVVVVVTALPLSSVTVEVTVVVVVDVEVRMLARVLIFSDRSLRFSPTLEMSTFSSFVGTVGFVPWGDSPGLMSLGGGPDELSPEKP